MDSIFSIFISHFQDLLLYTMDFDGAYFVDTLFGFYC